MYKKQPWFVWPEISFSLQWQRWGPRSFISQWSDRKRVQRRRRDCYHQECTHCPSNRNYSNTKERTVQKGRPGGRSSLHRRWEPRHRCQTGSKIPTENIKWDKTLLKWLWLGVIMLCYAVCSDFLFFTFFPDPASSSPAALQYRSSWLADGGHGIESACPHRYGLTEFFEYSDT